MAYETNTGNNNQQNTNSNGQRKADAFANVFVTDLAGGKHKVGKGIPLFRTNAVDKAIIEAMEADPDYVFEISAEVRVVDHSAKENIMFGNKPAVAPSNDDDTTNGDDAPAAAKGAKSKAA